MEAKILSMQGEITPQYLGVGRKLLYNLVLLYKRYPRKWPPRFSITPKGLENGQQRTNFVTRSRSSPGMKFVRWHHVRTKVCHAKPRVDIFSMHHYIAFTTSINQDPMFIPAFFPEYILRNTRNV